jgi:hypothetical protein
LKKVFFICAAFLTIGLTVSFLTRPIMIIISLVGCAIVTAIFASIFSKDYVREFKHLIIQHIVDYIQDGLKYSPDRCIPQNVYELSEIFQTHVDRYKGDDLVEGLIGTTDFCFSELHTEYKTQSGKNTSWHTIFRGLFFITKFKKDFSGKTIILPDAAEKLFGFIGQSMQSWNFSRDQLIKLENPEFEKEFVVYGTNQIESRYILTPKMMEQIVDFKKKYGKQIYISFVGSLAFVAVSYDRDMFEPKLLSTLLDFEPIKQYFEDIQFAISIADELSLNDQI